MKYRIRNLIERNFQGRMQVIAGEKYLDNEIKGVTIIEAPDIVKFINGGEVLLTGLYAFKSCDLSEMEECIRELEQKKISAIILKKGRNVDFAEEKVEMFKSYADRSRIPCLSMDFDLSFKDVMEVIMGELFSEEVKRLKYFKTTRDNFEALALALKPEEDGIVKLLTVLGKLISNPTGVYDQNGVCIGETKTTPADMEITEEMTPVDPEIASNYQYMKRCVYIYGEGRTADQYVVRLKCMFGMQLYLVVTEMGEKLDAMDYIAIDSAVSALQQELSRRYAVLELEKKYQNDILHDILHGEVHFIEDMKKSVSLLGMSFGGTYRVIIFGMEYGKGKEPKDINVKIDDVTLLKERIRRLFPGAVILNEPNKIVVVETEDAKKQECEFRQEIKNAVKKLKEFLREQKKGFCIKAGVGKKVSGVVNLRCSYREAEDALGFLDIADGIFKEEDSDVLLFSDMGVLKLLSGLRTEEELQEYIPETLQKLYRDNKSQKKEWILTLSTYLDCNQNLMKTAKELHIHYKTVAYRIERISAMTGMQFDDAREMLSVRIGLVACKMLDKLKKE